MEISTASAPIIGHSGDAGGRVHDLDSRTPGAIQTISGRIILPPRNSSHETEEEHLGGVGIILLFPVLDFGGIESRAVIQAQAMVEDYPGLRFCCFERAGRAADEIRKLGVPVDVLGSRPSVRNPIATWELWRYLRAHRPSVLHACSGSMTVHGLLAGWLAGVPVRIVEEVGIPSRGHLGHRLFPLLYRLASAVIGVADAVVAYLIERDGVPPAKVNRIYNPVESRYFDQPVRSMSWEGFRILSVGRLAAIKGHAELLRVMADVVLERPGISLRIVGDGPERSSLQQLASEIGIEDSVTFLGHRRDVPKLLASSDVLVLSSRSEGFPLVVVEAMASGVPVIATRVGGVSEAFPDWAADWLVPPADHDALRSAIVRMSRMSASDRDTLGRRLRVHAKHNFRPEHHAAALVQLYAELLAEVDGR